MSARNDRSKFDKPKSKLFTPDPYYIPGYCGYCPMQKYQLGETYGKTTAKILIDDSIAKSPHLVLSEKTVKGQDNSRRRNRQKKANIDPAGGCEYKIINGDMVPGYTGYIAKSEKYFGDRFAVICDHATNDIIKHNENNRKSKQSQQNRALPCLSAVRPKAEKYNPANKATSGASPYFTQDVKEKSFISGYTGFIPHARSRYAKGYPVETREALIEFTKDMQNNSRVEKMPVRLVREAVKKERNSESKSLYDSNVAMLPHYTGYLPGHKFRYALTYGNSSLIQPPYCKQLTK